MVNDWLTASWKMVLVRGAIAIVFGLVAIFWPIFEERTLASVAEGKRADLARLFDLRARAHREHVTYGEHAR